MTREQRRNEWQSVSVLGMYSMFRATAL